MDIKSWAFLKIFLFTNQHSLIQWTDSLSTEKNTQSLTRTVSHSLMNHKYLNIRSTRRALKLQKVQSSVENMISVHSSLSKIRMVWMKRWCLRKSTSISRTNVTIITLSNTNLLISAAIMSTICSLQRSWTKIVLLKSSVLINCSNSPKLNKICSINKLKVILISF